MNRELHRAIDRELRGVAKRRAALDAEEARWLREAERHEIWRRLGFATLLEYLEDVFGHAPRTAKERLRVAKALGELPALEAELRAGAMSFSAVKELTRVMTPATEAEWLAAARGRNVRDIEDLVVGRKKGDLPTDPKDPTLMTRDVVFTLDARRQALLQQARAMLEAERGEHIENAELLEALCMCALQPNATTGATTDVATDVACDVTTDLTTAANTVRKAPRPMHQIVVSKCGDCTRAWMQGRGTLLPIDSSDVSAAECDAVTIRDRDIADAQAAGRRRPQATSTIPTKTRDLVWARDEGRCRFPGCRAMRHLALHHIVFREHGGSHDEWNLVLLCDGHHKQLHDGLVTITGRAPDDLVFVRDGRQLIDSRAPVAMASASPARPRASTTRSSRFAEVVTLAEAKQALQELGYKSRAAQRALEQVRAHVGTNADVSALVRAVLDLDRAEQAKSAVCDESVGTLATRALVQAGFSAAIAEQAVARASAHVGTETDIPTFLKEALRHCVA